MEISMKIVKMSLLIILVIISFVFWNLVFILQSGFGHHGPMLLIPVKFLPLFLFSTFFTWIIFRLFVKDFKKSQMGWACLFTGILSVSLSLYFQHYKAEVKPFHFQDKMFKHVGETNINHDVKNRLALSALAYLKLIPKKTIDQNIIDYASAVATEALFVLELKSLVAGNEIVKTCKEYISQQGEFNSCQIDLMKAINREVELSSTGNVLLVTIITMGIMNDKHHLEQKNKKDAQLITDKITNDLIESMLLTAERTKTKLLAPSKTSLSRFDPSSSYSPIFYLFEERFNYGLLKTALEKIPGFFKPLKKDLKKISLSEANEYERSKSLKTRYESLMANGFSSDEIKTHLNEIDKRIDNEFEILKTNSSLFKTASYFRPSLKNIKFTDFKMSK